MLSEEQEKAKALVHKHPYYKRISKGSPLCNKTKLVYSTGRLDHVQVLAECIKTSDKEVEDTNDNKGVETEIKKLHNKVSKRACNTGEQEDLPPLRDNLKVQMIADGEIDDDQIIEPDNETATDLSKDTLTFTELLLMPDTEIPFVVENLIPEDSITILSGDSDAGKTSWYQQLCLAIIRGEKQHLGLKLEVKHKHVLIINTEDSWKSIKFKLLKQLAGVHLSTEESDRLTIMTLCKDVEAKIESFLEANPVDLVVIDAFSDVYDGDIRSDNAARTFMNKYIEIIRKFGCAILFVHHIGKGKDALGPNKDSMLGSAAIHGKARSVLMMTKHRTNPYIKSLKIVKANYVSEDIKSKQIILEFDPKTLLHKAVVDESLKEEIATQQKQTEKTGYKRRGKTDLEIQQAWELRLEGKSDDEIAKIQGLARSTVWRRLKDYKPLYDVDEAI